MGNEESIGQSGDFGSLGANSAMMSSTFNQRTNQGLGAAPMASSFPSASRPNAASNQMSAGFANRLAGTSSVVASVSPGPGPGPPLPDVDLSGLTEEEKMMIQSVMARAEQETGGSTPVMTAPARSCCPLCRQELSDFNAGPKCLDCSKLVCVKCGQHLPAGPDGKVSLVGSLGNEQAICLRLTLRAINHNKL